MQLYRLWTKFELLDKCGSYMADKCAQSNHAEYVPIDVQCVPPLLGEEFQSKQLFNGNQPQSGENRFLVIFDALVRVHL